MPPPSSGGVTIAMIAHILEGWDLRAIGWHSADELHLTFEAMRRAFAARNAKLGDPDFVKNPVDELLSDAWAQAQRATIKPDRATPTRASFPSRASAGRAAAHDALLGRRRARQRRRADDDAQRLVRQRRHRARRRLRAQRRDGRLRDGPRHGEHLRPRAGRAERGRARQADALVDVADASCSTPTAQSSSSLGGAGGPRIITAVFEELSNVIDFGMTPRTPCARRASTSRTRRTCSSSSRRPAGGRRRRARRDGSRHEGGRAPRRRAGDRPRPGLWVAGPEPRREGGLGLGL